MNIPILYVNLKDKTDLTEIANKAEEVWNNLADTPDYSRPKGFYNDFIRLFGQEKLPTQNEINLFLKKYNIS